MKKFLIIIFSFGLLIGEFITEYLVVEGDTLDDFIYQIPILDENQNNVPLLVTFHQWSGTAMSTTYTDFDEEAYNRGWYFLSPFGGSSNNYNHQGAQDLWELEIIWMINQFNIDEKRIYFVGGSMGGAAGMVYANNHLDPQKPMVAATASGSGILDCERRFYEMDGNNSMIEWFGGTPDQVPFEYHRNSAVFFSDSTKSMHNNLQYTPLYFDFGSTEAHRQHAEDLYDLLININESMWIENNPEIGHGYSIMDETHTCNWLEQFELIDNPDNIKVNLDEPSRAYWIQPFNQIDNTDFINVHVNRIHEALNLRPDFEIYQYDNSDSVIFNILDMPYSEFNIKNNTTNNIFIGINGEFLDLVHTAEIISNYLEYFWIEPDSILWFLIYPNTEIEFIVNYDFIINDVTLDGNWDILDIVSTIYFIFDWTYLSFLQQQYADLNDDISVNIQDILLMIDLILEN